MGLIIVQKRKDVPYPFQPVFDTYLLAISLVSYFDNGKKALEKKGFLPSISSPRLIWTNKATSRRDDSG